MIENLFCENCENDDLFIVEYYNTLMDCETIRDISSQDEFDDMMERAEEDHIVRIDCGKCPEKIYDS